jgi:hypothetical protein
LLYFATINKTLSKPKLFTVSGYLCLKLSTFNCHLLTLLARLPMQLMNHQGP